MDKTELLKKLTTLEIEHDRYLGEIATLDTLMRSIGFEKGLETVKETAKAISEKNQEKN